MKNKITDIEIRGDNRIQVVKSTIINCFDSLEVVTYTSTEFKIEIGRAKTHCEVYYTTNKARAIKIVDLCNKLKVPVYIY